LARTRFSAQNRISPAAWTEPPANPGNSIDNIDDEQ